MRRRKRPFIYRYGLLTGGSVRLKQFSTPGLTALTLPPVVIASLGLLWRTRGAVMFANGTEAQCNIYTATVIWDSRTRHILVEAADTDPLIGMALLYHHDVRMQVIEGGRVIIEALL